MSDTILTMSRLEKRKITRDISVLVKKAKIDMETYIASLSYTPSDFEIKAWQAGYIAGINRGTNNK